MKKNKIFIYIAIFFALFLIGTKKVKADTTYTMCKYRAKANNYDVSLTAHQDIWILLKNGKTEQVYANQPNDIKSNAYMEYQIFDIKDKLFDIVEKSTTTKCPTIRVNGYVTVFGNYKANSRKIGPLETIESSTANVKNSFQCSYEKSQGNAERIGNNITVTFDTSHLSNHSTQYYGKGMISGVSEPNLGFVWTTSNIAKDTVYLFNYEASSILSYLHWTKGRCPAVYHGWNHSQPAVFTRLTDLDNLGDFQYKLVCDKNIATREYLDARKWVLDNKSPSKYDKEMGRKINKYCKVVLDGDKKMSTTETEACNSNGKQNAAGVCDKLITACGKVDECGDQIEESTKKAAHNAQKLKTLKLKGINVNYDDLTCDTIFGNKNNPQDLMYVINKVVIAIRIAIPIMLIVFGFVDFSRVVTSQDQDAMKKTVSKFSKRCIAAIILFILPTLITIIMGWIDKYMMNTDPDCVIGNYGYIIMKLFWR